MGGRRQTGCKTIGARGDQITASSVCPFLPLANGQPLLAVSDGLGILQTCPVQQVQCCSDFDATILRDSSSRGNDIISRLKQPVFGFNVWLMQFVSCEINSLKLTSTVLSIKISKSLKETNLKLLTQKKIMDSSESAAAVIVGGKFCKDGVKDRWSHN